MDDAFSKEGQAFADALYRVKASTENFIDGHHIQAFHGLVEYARVEPQTVKQMFENLLLTDDGGDLKVKEQLIADFFMKSDDYSKNTFQAAIDISKIPIQYLHICFYMRQRLIICIRQKMLKYLQIIWNFMMIGELEIILG